MSYTLYFLSIFALAQSAVITKWSPLSIEQLGFWRLLIAAFIIKLIFSPKSFWRWPTKPQGLLYLLICGLSLYLHFYSYFYAAKNTSVANTLLLFSLNPLFTGLISKYVLKEVFSKNMIWSFVFGLAALIALVYPMLFLQDSSLSLADASALFSGFAYSIYIVSAKLSHRYEDHSTVISWSFLIASGCFMAKLVTSHQEVWVSSSEGILSLGLLILFPTLLGHAVFLYLTKSLNINWMSVGKLAEPPMAALLAYIVLGQIPSLSFYAAFFFLMTSCLFLFKDRLHLKS